MGAVLFHMDGWMDSWTDLYDKVHSYFLQFYECTLKTHKLCQ